MLSILIPSRNEIYLQKTIDGILSAAEGEIEVIAILDGYWPDPPIQDDQRIKLIHHTKALGQRPSINEAARIAKGDYILKSDAHCMFDQGFDIKLIADCEYDWTVIPRQLQLNPVKWQPKAGKRSDFMYFNSPYAEHQPMRIQYYDKKMYREHPADYKAFKESQWRRGDISDTMASLGAVWFMHKDRFWELGGMDENHGHWGQMAVELACKTWLSGGRQIVNKKTWFAHLWRKKPPWNLTHKVENQSRDYSIKFWTEGKWPLQKYPLEWLADRFAPVPTWEIYESIAYCSVCEKETLHYGSEVIGITCNVCKKYTPDDIDEDEKFSPVLTWNGEPKHKKEFDEYCYLYEKRYGKHGPSISSSCDGKHKQENCGCWECHLIELREWDKKMDDITLLYYTANVINKDFQNKVIDNLKENAKCHDIISISHKSMEFGRNIVMDIGRSVQSIYKQVYRGCIEAKTEYVALCEDDCLYSPSHFDLRPKGIGYNYNRWCLHPDKNLFTYWKRPVLSMCIARREALIDALRPRMSMDIPKEYCGEPGRFESKLGLPKIEWDILNSEQPNIVICHDKNITGRKLQGKDAAPRTEIEGWGKAEDVVKAYCPQEKEQIYKSKYKRPRSNIGGIEKYPVAELYENRFAISEPTKKRDREFYFRAFEDFIDNLIADKKWTDEEIVQHEYYEYLITKLNPADRNPLTHKGKRHAIKKFRDAIILFEDIKKNGIKSPLHFYCEDGGVLRLYRGGRRLIILHKLGWDIVPIRVFKTHDDLRRYDPSITTDQWHTKDKEMKSIHELAMEQFSKYEGGSTDKYWIHGYTKEYDKVFDMWRNGKIKILEFGLLRGASLRLWHSAFPRAQIYGVDKHRNYWRKLTKDLDRIKVFVGSQQDTKFLEEQVIPEGPYHIIIDDCGHAPENQMSCFHTMYPHLKSHGFYVIEDCWHSYADHNKSGINMPKTFASWIDCLYTNFEILSLQFYYNLCVIQKGL